MIYKNLSLIVAMSVNGVIGIGNNLPWNIPEDLKRFKEITQGNIVIMGRKTFESIGKPLPNRINIVITKQKGYQQKYPDVIKVFNDINAVKTMIASHNNSFYVIGGEENYKEFVSCAKHILITEIQQEFVGDAFFPMFDKNLWTVGEMKPFNLVKPVPSYIYKTYTRK